MGVPKFFRYISERYPCLSELAREQCIPDFDNLYLDMNGIIHTCSHPDDGNIHFHMTEEEMFKEIFNYIEKLFFLIKPQKLFFLAVDGVAPRAKMNQQRSRRFRSAKDAEMLEEKAKTRGEIRQQDRFDSNCITPGTEFMSRLNEALRCFIRTKLSKDPLWKKCRVILSGHDCPGEGEHKIMEYIRFLKAQPEYEPATRHCLYGLDADLIILGLCTHQQHFVVLREEVKFGRKTKRTSVEETRFFLLHLGLLRQYLELEFEELRKYEPELSIYKLIDDWILMGFLIGNDFVPHLPLLHINKNVLPMLYKTYIKVYPELGGNINEEGRLNLERLEKYFAALAEVEYEQFVQNNASFRDLETTYDSKTSKANEAFDFDVSEINNENIDEELEAFIESSNKFFEDDNSDNSMDENQQLAEEFEVYKRNYYMEKFQQQDISTAIKMEQAKTYIAALQWILDYYYCGVQSWDWYYPYHYAPFISDLKDFKDFEIIFNIGRPFLPFQQLLAVLPAASKELLPPAYRDLMTSANSELIDFYPNDFKTDLNGKQHEWEAVVLIPFIDEKKLLTAMKKCESQLTNEEKLRNAHGPMIQFDFCAPTQGSDPGANLLSPVANANCLEKKITSKDVAIDHEQKQSHVGTELVPNIFFSGFPTMKHLNFKFKIAHARVKVFELNSRNESLILQPECRPDLHDPVATAEKYLNQIVFIGWPHLIKSKVVAVSDATVSINNEGITNKDASIYRHQTSELDFHLKTRMGIEFNDYTVLLHVKTFVGTSYICGKRGQISKTDLWSRNITTYPAEGVVMDLHIHDWKTDESYNKVEDLFAPDSTVFFIGNPYYGSEGTILDAKNYYEFGRLSVRITVHSEPEFHEAKELQEILDSDFINSYQAANRLKMSAKCLARVTGTVLVVSGQKRFELPENVSKTNIGLQLRYPKQREERAGYARRVNNQWFYSSKAIQSVQDYFEKYPMVFEYLNNSSDKCDLCFESDIFPERVGEKLLDELASWIKSLEHMQAERVPSDSKTLGKESILKVLDVVEKLEILPKKTVKLQVKPHLLLKPDVTLPHVYKSKQPIQLFDRVIIVKTTYMIPLGSKGTVIGIQPVIDPNPVRLECVKSVENFYKILFDNVISNISNIYGIADQRVNKVPESSVLLLSFKDNLNEEPQINVFNATTSTSQHKTIATRHAQKPVATTTSNNSNMGRYDAGNTNSAFWMPAEDRKIKHEALTPNSTNPYQNQQNQLGNYKQHQQQHQHQQHHQQKRQQQRQQKQQPQQQQQQQQTIYNSDKSIETETLKSLLGLTLQPNVSNDERQLHSNFPQPPTNWRSGAQHTTALPYHQQHQQRSSKPAVMLRSIPYSNNLLESNPPGSSCPPSTSYSEKPTTSHFNLTKITADEGKADNNVDQNNTQRNKPKAVNKAPPRVSKVAAKFDLKG